MSSRSGTRSAFRRYRQLAREDLAVLYDAQPWLCAQGRARRWLVLVMDPGVMAVVTIRFQGLLEELGLIWGARVMRRRNLRLRGIDWAIGARAEGGLAIRHPVGVVVGWDTRIGERVRIMQGVTLGQRHVGAAKDRRNPRVGDDVLIGAGAKVLGPVVIGNGARVSANTVVTRDVQAGGTVRA